MISDLLHQHQLDISYIKLYLNNIENILKNNSKALDEIKNIEVLILHLDEITIQLSSEIETLAKKLNLSNKRYLNLSLDDEI